ncbi:MAG: LytR/AlgR family response regulator transcription factor [Lachnospiraceae bacterium]
MKKILILEDDYDAAERLRKIICSINGNIEVFHVASCSDACKIVFEEVFTVFIVDIVLDRRDPNDASGLDFIRFLREIGQYEFSPVIITTAIADSKLYAYDNLHCYQYLEKPFHMEQVRAAIEQALKMPQKKEQERYIHLRDDSTVLAQKVEEIVYVYYKNRKLVLRSIDGVSIFYYRSLSEIRKQLFSNDFLQCNRNTLVNRKFIWKVDMVNGKIKLKEKYGELLIGTTYRRKICEEFAYD